LYHVGTNTSGDSAPLNFATDIDGQSRGTTCDVGDDQYVSADDISCDMLPIFFTQ
jgi:hypothetical protein